MQKFAPPLEKASFVHRRFPWLSTEKVVVIEPGFALGTNAAKASVDPQPN